MDFRQNYSMEQQAFRQVVRAWLGQHVPRDVDIPLDGGPLDPEIQKRIKVFRRQVGEQGWLAPTWPKAYGGGGLSPSLALVVQEEMQAGIATHGG